MFASTGINVENLNLLTEVHNHSALHNWRIFEVALFGHKKAWSRVVVYCFCGNVAEKR